MVLSFQFGRQAMCPGVRALLCPETGPCEKHSVGGGGGQRREFLSSVCCQSKDVDGIIINAGT